MRLLFFIIFFFASYAFTATHASSLEERIIEPQLKVKYLKLLDIKWDSHIFNWKTGTENPDITRVSYLNLGLSPATCIINGYAYQLVYLEAAFPKGRYNTKMTFPAFLKKHSVIALKYDPFSNFYVLSKLVESNPEARVCETLSFFEYFPESDESYTISFIRQTDLMDFQSDS